MVGSTRERREHLVLTVCLARRGPRTRDVSDVEYVFVKRAYACVITEQHDKCRDGDGKCPLSTDAAAAPSPETKGIWGWILKNEYVRGG